MDVQQMLQAQAAASQTASMGYLSAFGGAGIPQPSVPQLQPNLFSGLLPGGAAAPTAQGATALTAAPGFPPPFSTGSAASPGLPTTTPAMLGLPMTSPAAPGLQVNSPAMLGSRAAAPQTNSSAMAALLAQAQQPQVPGAMPPPPGGIPGVGATGVPALGVPGGLPGTPAVVPSPLANPALTTLLTGALGGGAVGSSATSPGVAPTATPALATLLGAAAGSPGGAASAQAVLASLLANAAGAAAGAGPGGSSATAVVGGPPPGSAAALLQHPAIQAALAQLQGKKLEPSTVQMPQDKVAETMQRLDTVNKLQQLLADNERKKSELKQQTVNLQVATKGVGVPSPADAAMAAVAPNALSGVVAGGMPGVVPGAVPGALPGVVPGALPGALPGAVPGALPGAGPGAGALLGPVPGAVPVAVAESAAAPVASAVAPPRVQPPPPPGKPSAKEAVISPKPMEVVETKKPQSPEEARAAAVAVLRAQAEEKAQAEKEELAKKVQEAERLKCHLHKKPKENCKFCKKHKEFIVDNGLDGSSDPKKPATSAGGIGDTRKDFDSISSSATALLGPIEIANKKTYGFTPVAQSHILDTKYYESTLVLISTLDELIEEARKYVKSVEPYMPDSTTMPTPFFCIVYRLFTLGLDARHVRRLIDCTDSAFVRCLGFVYLRLGLPAENLWAWLGDYVTDIEDFQPVGGSWSTVGEFVEDLLIKEKYYTTLLPRISGGIRQNLEKRLAPVTQYRKRLRANREISDLYDKPGTRVEVSIDGRWHEAATVDLEDHPSRPKVHVRLLGSDSEEFAVDLGRVIMVDKLPANRKVRRDRSRSRSRSKDWTRHKGKSDAELIEEMRQSARERAVCAAGKNYSARPTTFDKGLAQPREGQGYAARRLLEEETYVRMMDNRKRDSPPREHGKGSEPSVEHQERMRKLFEKYGSAKPKDTSAASGVNFIESPDLMRLG